MEVFMVNKYLISLILGLFSGCFLLAYLGHYTLQNSSFKASNLAQDQKNAHDHSLDAIKKEFNIPEADWRRTLNFIEDLKARDTLMGPAKELIPHDSPFIQRIHEILKEYGINPEYVIIKDLQGPDYKAQAIQCVDKKGSITHILELNSEWLNGFAWEIQEGILRHEIMHLIHYDCIEEHYILGLLDSLGFVEKEYTCKESIIAYRHQREIRADLLACSHGSEITTAMRLYYDICALESDHYLPETWNTHPKDSQRAQKLAQMFYDMNTTKFS